MVQPYYKGKHMDKDKFGYDGEQWGGFPVGPSLNEVYLSTDLDKYRTIKI